MQIWRLRKPYVDVNKRFRLGFKPKKKDFAIAAEIKREKKVALIEGRNPNKRIMEILSIQVTFL
jgi:hypothetical protein